MLHTKNSMEIIVTDNSRNYLFQIVDLMTSKIIHRQPILPEYSQEIKEPDLINHIPSIRPYGITWTNKDIIIANNGQIIYIDAKSFKKNRIESRFPPKTHQIIHHDGLWATITRKDLIFWEQQGFFCVKTNQWIQYDKSLDDIEEIHVNSINVYDDKIYVGINDLQADQAFILIYNKEMNLLQKLQTGMYCHGISVEINDIYVLNSSKRTILGQKNIIKVPQKGQTSIRGFASTKEYFIIGRFPSSIWPPYKTGDSEIIVISKDTFQIEKIVPLQNTGSINDLRVISEKDYCHHVDHCFPY